MIFRNADTKQNYRMTETYVAKSKQPKFMVSRRPQIRWNTECGIYFDGLRVIRTEHFTVTFQTSIENTEYRKAGVNSG